MKKRLSVILACFILFSVAALAAGVSVTLNASDSVEIQAAAFTAYLDSLNEADQREWRHVPVADRLPPKNRSLLAKQGRGRILELNRLSRAER